MTSLARRVGQLERIEAARRLPVREHVYRVMERLGGTLPAAQVEEIVARHVDTPNRIRRWRDECLSQAQILDRLGVRP
jgi:hypothetical protein